MLQAPNLALRNLNNIWTTGRHGCGLTRLRKKSARKNMYHAFFSGQTADKWQLFQVAKKSANRAVLQELLIMMMSTRNLSRAKVDDLLYFYRFAKSVIARRWTMVCQRILIWKKGSPADRTSHRSIHMISHTMEIVERIVDGRICDVFLLSFY